MGVPGPGGGDEMNVPGVTGGQEGTSGPRIESTLHGAVLVSSPRLLIAVRQKSNLI